MVKLRQSGYYERVEVICGIDEAGRGPLAGPVTAAAVVLPAGFPPELLADSKTLSPACRQSSAVRIMCDAVDWALGWAWPEEIDRLNIHRATLLAMQRAFRGLRAGVTLAIIDGLFTPSLPVTARAIVRGDAKIPEIMAASIVAKVARDRWMVRYAWIEPEYGFDRHKGYPTAAHREVCIAKGLSAIHRRSFRVVADRRSSSS